jgi:Terminase small subunit
LGGCGKNLRVPSVSPNSRKDRANKFAANYVKNGFRLRKAVIDAGITKNPNSAGVIGNRLLSDDMTVEAVERHMKKAKLSADEVLERLADIAQREAKFSGADVVKATELLGKGHKLFTDRVESEVTTVDSKSAQQLFAEQYREVNRCTEAEALEAAANAFAFTKIDDQTENPAS